MTVTVEIEEVAMDARVIVKGVKGTRVVWLSGEGFLEATTMYADLFEIPRCPLTKVDSDRTPEETAKALAEEVAMTHVRVVLWPEVPDGLSYGPYPAAIGIAFTQPVA